MKKIDIALLGIACFAFGSYTTFLINFFYFNNDITPAGVSACIAGMALLFTIYAAYKANQWLEIKHKDKAFKQCEKIIDDLANAYVNFVMSNSNIKFILNQKDDMPDKKVNVEYSANQYDENINKVDEFMLSAISLAESLPFWGYNVKTINDTDIFIDINNKIIAHRLLCNELLDIVLVKKSSIFNASLKLKDKIENSSKDCSTAIVKVFNSKFDDVFIKNITSLSKKVTK